MKAFLLLVLLVMIQSDIVECRYVTKASRDRVRHHRRNMEKIYGVGLVGLIDPITQQFNHKKVIQQRGGRHDWEVIGSTRYLRQGLGWLHRKLESNSNFRIKRQDDSSAAPAADDDSATGGGVNPDGTSADSGQEAFTTYTSDGTAQYWDELGDKTFDHYDIWSFYYGWITAIQDPDSVGPSACFTAAFSFVQSTDLWWQDLLGIFQNKNFFNIVVYTPMHISGNFAASYEYCNFYVISNQLQYVAMLDYGYLSELMTRWSLLLSQELLPFLIDLSGIFGEKYMDWYLFGFRWGVLFTQLADFKLSS